MTEYIELIKNSEDWLMNRILEYAVKLEFTKYTSTLAEAWRLSVSGLSGSLILAAKHYSDNIPELHPDDKYINDPISKFGIIEAQKHRVRGTTLGMFLGLMKYYKESYIDLIEHSVKEKTKNQFYKNFTQRCFDRIEIAYCIEWTSHSGDNLLLELQDSNRKITNEKNKYLTIFESSYAPIILLDENLKISNLNQAAIELFTNLNPSKGDHIWLKVDAANSSTISEVYNLYKSNSNNPYPNEEIPLLVAMSGLSKHVDDMIVVKPDGTKTDLEAFGSPVVDDKGNIWASLVSFQDITERKQADLALKEREKEFRSLAESMPQIVWTTHADGWNTYFNQQWVDYTGLTLEESYGHGWNISFHPEDKQRAWDAWQNAVNNNAEYSIECRLRCHDGTYHWWLIRGVPQIGAGGKIIKFYGTCTDIEKIKEAELALKESEKQLLRLNADKDRFISILGHDLKSPFNNILGFSEVLIEEARNLNTDKIEVIANYINKSAMHTNKLLEDILMWSRAQQGSIAFEPKKLRLSKACRNIHEIMNPNASLKNVEIIDSSINNIDVYADSNMIKTILLNLVSNAIKFSNSGGKINIKAEQNSENVTISVSDNGVGIPAANLAKLFVISEVLSTKGTAGETGTGLGLLLCKEFVEKHGGKIWAESEVGKGSDFKFTLPVSD